MARELRGPSPRGGQSERRGEPRRSSRSRDSHRTGTHKARWVTATVIVAALAALVVAQNAQDQTSKDQTSRTPGTDRPAGVALRTQGGFEVGDKAPSFSAATTSGSTFSLPAGKPTAVFFMAGWCGTCLPEAEALAAIDKELGDRVAIVAVSADPTDSVDALRHFAGEAAADYGFVHDKEGALVTAFGVRALDTTFVLDAAGRIVFRDAVPTDEATLRQWLDRAGRA